MAIEPAAISARPAVTTMADELTAPDSPAARAKGTVKPSDMPMTTSLTAAPAVKCCSTWGVCGTADLRNPGAYSENRAEETIDPRHTSGVRVDVPVGVQPGDVDC